MQMSHGLILQLGKEVLVSKYPNADGQELMHVVLVALVHWAIEWRIAANEVVEEIFKHLWVGLRKAYDQLFALDETLVQRFDEPRR